MGCGSSKTDGEKPEKHDKQSGARNDHPPIDPITVPDIDPKYPAPTPAPNYKEDFYKPSDYTAIDARVKQQLPSMRATTYDTLIKSICANCVTDLQKLRAIMVWLFHQDIHGSFYSGVKDPYTPRGYMKLIKTSDGSYEAFFAQLCRAAGIPCNVIRGVAKGDKYKIGQQDMTGLESAWNAVYVSGAWRLVHPLWAIFKEKQTYVDGKRPPAGTKRTSLYEFYWLIDANRLICFCKPHSDPWQLLKVRWEHKKFVKSPLFTEHYFTSGLMLPKKYNAIIYSDNGVCLIDFDHHEYEEIDLDATVTFNDAESEEDMPQYIKMKDYTLVSRSSNRKSVVIRFPVRGKYEVDVFGGSDPSEPKLVKFILQCDDMGRDPQPFPIHPAGGLGLQSVASQFGISDPIPDSGIVLVKPAQQKHFSFTCTQPLEVQATMFHTRIPSENFEDFISTKTTSDEVHVTVAVPDETHLEYGLQISVRPANASRLFTVVAYYLLVDENWRRKTAVIQPRPSVNKNEEDRIRKALVAATQKNDIDKLEMAIEEFEKNGLPDNGDLTRARNKLYQLHLQRLRKTTLERKLEDLDNAIESAKRSHVAIDLSNTKEMDEAIATRQQLRRLRLYMHKVLALNKATISEIHSYQRPRPLVHTVMKATFRMLGEPNSKIQDWSYIQNSMRTLGRNSMIARMRRTDVVTLKKGQVTDAERYLGQTNKHLVRLTSAGAGTFYVWSHNMISEFQGKNDLDPLEVWSDNNKWAKTRPRKKGEGQGQFETPREVYSPETPHTRRSNEPGQFEDEWDPNRAPAQKQDDWDPNRAPAQKQDEWDPNRTPARKQDDWDPNRAPAQKHNTLAEINQNKKNNTLGETNSNEKKKKYGENASNQKQTKFGDSNNNERKNKLRESNNNEKKNKFGENREIPKPKKKKTLDAIAEDRRYSEHFDTSPTR